DWSGCCRCATCSRRTRPESPVLPLAEGGATPTTRRHSGRMNGTARTVADRLLDARIVMLTDEVSDESAHRVIAELLALSADDPESDICMFVNSPGGAVLAGLGIYDVMQLIPNDVVTVATGFAASMGQVLL